MSSQIVDQISSEEPQIQESEVKYELFPITNTFQVNRDIIEAVLPENQPEELRALGIAVYDQTTFEEGILQQVDDAFNEREQQKASQGNKPKKNTTNESSVLGGPKENEKEKLIRFGHMTPFGTVLGQGTKTNGLSSFEKYMLEQERLSNEKLKSSSKKGKSLRATSSSRLQSTIPSNQTPALSSKKRSSKDDSDSDYVPGVEEKRSVNKAKRQSNARKRKSGNLDSNSWHSDDSDWEYSASEDEASPKKKRRTNGRVIDDGNSKDFKERVSTLSLHPEYDEHKQFEGGYRIPLAVWDKLFNYQKVGVRWMYELRLQRCGGILGDEMGLGKTIQVVAFLAGLSYSNIITRLSNYRGLGPVLLVTPATVMHQWVKEFHKWWPPLRVAILHESGSHSGTRDRLVKSINASNGVLITSYTGVVNYSEALLGLEWDYVILDEGHKIRNPDAQATLTVKQFRTCNRFILSGSPMQNNLKELWSLFDFIFPGKLGTLPVFLQQFAVPITQGGYANASQVQVATAYKCASILRDTINPYLLRRMKCDVKEHVKLPPKNEQVLFCRLTSEQRQMYQTYLDSGEIKKIIDGRMQIFVGLTNLRKICNHPDLFGDKKDDFGSVESSGKMLVVESLLRIWKEQNHRCLLFSQSRQMLDILEKYVQGQSYSYLRLDGTTGIGSRQPLIEKFNSSPEIFLFLLTTRVGGLGVNLTGANRVIIYDPDWNPSTDTQARERAWRIGQRKDVTVYRLLTSGTIEEKIYHRQIFKQYLTNRVLKDPKQRRFFKSNDLYELFTLKDTDNQCTETEAIFAGTGSEVTHIPREASSECRSLDKTDDKEWMLEWKRKREKREAEWHKALEKEKRKKERQSETDEQKKVRRKREKEEKKKDKQVKVDGAKVKNVIKMSDFQQGVVDDARAAPSSSNQDDYVLQRLFAKTGVLSAMRHDSIIDAGDPDYVLVEQEADRVAKEAVKELKTSRRTCWNAMAGVPTWTGANGSVRQPGAENPKPRFGTKTKNVAIESFKQLSTSGNSSEENSTRADSIEHNISLPGNSNMLASSDLLSRMQARNRLVGLPEPDNENDQDSLQSISIEEPLILNSQPAPLEFATEVDYLTMMDNVRSFVAFRGLVPGLVTTSDLLAEFNGNLPPKGAPLFRALLNQLCTFTRNANGEGIWQLKSEFQ